MKISVVINTFNAEKHLESVLEQLQAFDEVLICDMYSTDKTIEIAQKYRCTIIYHEKTGVVEPARNAAIQAAKHDWVLVLDADEIVPPALREFLYDQIRLDGCPSAIRIPMKNYFLGCFMHAAYPSYLLRFFRKDLVFWPPFVHAQPQITGSILTIPADRRELAFIHLANDSVEDNIRKTNLYTKQELERRKNKKYGYCALFGESLVRFTKFYLFKGGIRDGKAGLLYAGLNAFYKFTTIAKVWESRVDEEKCDKELMKYN